MKAQKALFLKRGGGRGNHCLPEELKWQALELIVQNYSDFGPTLAHEYLIEKHGLKISISSIRNMMIMNNLHISKAKRRKRAYELRPIE